MKQQQKIHEANLIFTRQLIETTIQKKRLDDLHAFYNVDKSVNGSRSALKNIGIDVFQ
ncbi:MAG: hypothetical protein LKG79_09815 [Furfurilactobacillus sp.]|jgi:hypothetical protein|uniref:Uncharacterized protein n=1 Tax=Furfurilactobacillus milii TaxID=2888272 RepID=A0ABT6DBC2_9LACO|nr:MULTISPECIES: hypothetical protein [Furfurilactobacillus]QLE67356.1 hypothetical protein LROSL2_2006 [Furfurilactobacillus rossiae]MCF6161563.1 hypothetical protein [Furfurilactobacillus milii]MCF6163943.1 hypothetical protein [Furfurilactobacillus milii]MCF6419411.1 hypothetical protein [Furfurilactobacillus milii]MCH4011545.1 hypothetical protein [Furfurilactobacillus sp.]